MLRRRWKTAGTHDCYPLDFGAPLVDALHACSTAIGLRVKDGVVLAVEKLLVSKMLVPGTNRRIHTVDRHCGLVSINAH